MEITDNFAHWIKAAAGIGNISADKYESRVSAILALTEKISTNEALDLLRLYCGITPKDNNALSTFTSHFKDQDPSFDTRDTPFVFRVLSAISLIQILNYSSDSADAVALALLTYTFNGNKKVLPEESVSADLETAARNYLSGESSQMRSIHKFEEITVTNKATDKVPGNLNLKELKTASELGPALTIVHTLFSAVDTVITNSGKEQITLVKAINEELQALHRSLQVNAEETNIFWWLASEWSRDLGKPYIELSPSQACLLAGKELADLNVFIPGHNSAKGFLSRILKFTTAQSSSGLKQKAQDTKPSITIKEAVNDAPTDWSKALLGTEKVQMATDFCPLHFALSKCLELGNDEWGKQFERHTGIKVSTSFPAYEISHQFFLERMMIRAGA